MVVSLEEEALVLEVVLQTDPSLCSPPKDMNRFKGKFLDRNH